MAGYPVDETNPLGVFLVSSGSKGDRLLFRFPYNVTLEKKEIAGHNKKSNPYALVISEDHFSSRSPYFSELGDRFVVGLPDKVLSNLFAVKPDLCGRKFELKVNDVRFVGHPTALGPVINREQFNIVFALRANASHAIVNCYHDLSQRLSIALKHEELRCRYLTSESKVMLAAHDEVAALPEGHCESPYRLILQSSQLARDLKTAYEDLRNSGRVHLRLNKWIEISFCLPHKVHRLHTKDLIIEPEAVQKCLSALRPYHALLLLVDCNDLLESLHQDASPALIRVVKVASPFKNLQCLAADADLTVPQVFQIVGHLVYWAKATIIYPLCETNVYVLSPNAPTQLNSPLVEKFRERFQVSLFTLMSEFSLPNSLSHLHSPLNTPQQQLLQLQMIVWMLQHRILMQLHKYVFLVPTSQPSSLLKKQSSHEDNRRISADEPLSFSYGTSVSDLGSSVPSEDSLLGSPPSQADLYSETHSKSGSEDELSLKEQRGDNLLPDLSAAEKESIMKIAAAKNPDDLRLFARLCPYFRGKHHLEEIMYCENIRRSQLLILLDKFRDVLFTTQFEDAAVAAFYRKPT